MIKINTGFRVLGVAAALGATTAGPLEAAPMTLDALISTKTQSKLEFADGSNRYLIALQREGKVTGSGPLAGATMLEWGVHDAIPGVGANGNGYLVFTTPEGHIAYLKYQFRAIPVPGTDGKPRILINGFWEVAGGSGGLKSLRGAGTVNIDVVSPKERRWKLEGDLSIAAQ